MNSTEKKSYFHYSLCIEQECGHSQPKNNPTMNFATYALPMKFGKIFCMGIGKKMAVVTLYTQHLIIVVDKFLQLPI